MKVGPVAEACDGDNEDLVPWEAQNFLIRCATVRFTRSTVLLCSSLSFDIAFRLHAVVSYSYKYKSSSIFKSNTTKYYLFTYLLTPWSSVLREKFTGPQLVKKLSEFC